MARHLPPTSNNVLDALLGCPLVHSLGASIPEPQLGRPPRHPAALHLAWAALARHLRSGNRLDSELMRTDLWDRILDRYNTAARAHPNGRPVNDGIARLYADTHRHTRDRFCDDDHLPLILDAFTDHSVQLANNVGLLLPSTTGSRTRPDPLNAIYGDGTILRPIYRGGNGQRADADALAHHRYDGEVIGTKLVHLATRGPEPHRRVILAAGYVADPGREADNAVELVRRVHARAADGINAVIYDGALRGTHHHELMTDLGLIVINRPHGTRSRRPRTLPLGIWNHDTPNGPCEHALVSHGGDICDIRTDDAGNTVRSEPCERVQVRRFKRPGDRYRFSLGVNVRCAQGDFTAWISPHPAPGDHTAGRPDQVRLIQPHEELFDQLYGLRNDAEAINAAYKRSHMFNRSPVLGWRRQLFDLLMWSLLNNSIAWWHHADRRAQLPNAA